MATSPNITSVNYRRKILIVDDEGPIRRLLTIALQNAGYFVEAMPDGSAGVQAIESQNFDLVITDLEMPHLRGDAVIEAVKAIDPSTPAMVISGRLEHGDVETLRALGADELVDKPFHLSSILATVERLLS
ncbi:MAG: response regulator [SAR202 cluster bacterium]|jgi:DNA-binding response OmpR family regulator|nr:response regulator [SAR202 cluster bacterium]